MEKTKAMEFLEHVDFETSDELEHYGRLGMKWGQHIFGRDEAKSKKQKRTRIERVKARLARKKAKMEAAEAKKKAKAEAALAKKKAADEKRRKEILSDPTKLYKYRKNFSQEEINQAIKQFEWEQKLNDLSVKKIEAGKKRVQAIAGTLSSVVGGYNTVASVVNAFADDINLPKVNMGAENKKKDKKKDD